MPLSESGDSARIVSRASDCDLCQDLQAGTCHIGSGSMNWRCMYYVSHRHDARRITAVTNSLHFGCGKESSDGDEEEEQYTEEA